jgi:Cof subfamily protein (haloacid dehalogenase superfamily)
MAYRLVACDLDGTLIRDDLTMSPRVRCSLEGVMDRGIHLVLASGRSFRSLESWVRELHVASPVITYQGAAVVDPATRRWLYHRSFVPEIGHRVVDFARSRKLELTLFVDDEIYVENKIHRDDFYDKWFGIPNHQVSDLSQALARDPTKFIIIGSPEELDGLRPAVEDQFSRELQIMRSHRFFLEGLPLGVTKGTALSWLAERLGVERSETMAIGDSDNDEAMIQWAGMGVAMGNAFPNVKAIARYVAPPVDEDGAAEAIERFCLRSSI